MIGRLRPSPLQKRCPFPNSLITAKKHNPESYTFFPFGRKKKKSAQLKCFQKQNTCSHLRRRLSGKASKSKNPTVRSKDLKRSSYVWPSECLNHAVRPSTRLVALHGPCCLPEDLGQLPLHVTAPPNAATVRRSRDSSPRRGAAGFAGPRRFGPAQSLFSAVTAEPLLQGGVSSRGRSEPWQRWGHPEGLGMGAGRPCKSACCTWRHPSRHIYRSQGVTGAARIQGVENRSPPWAWPGARALGLEERVRLHSGCCDQGAQAGGL